MPFTQEFIESLIKQNQMQLEQIEKLNKTIEELNATIKELDDNAASNDIVDTTPFTYHVVLKNSDNTPYTNGFTL